MEPTIRLDTEKSPAVTFATFDDGVVIACEPDGSFILGAASERSHMLSPADPFEPHASRINDALAAVAVAHRRALSGRAGVLG